MKRLQRLRATAALRDLVAETGFGRAQLIQPLFAIEGSDRSEPIAGLGDNRRLAPADLLAQVERDLAAGIRQFILFPVPAAKREREFSPDFAATAIESLKSRFGSELTLWLDLCLCSYSHTGHCCLFDSRGRQDLEGSLKELTRLAVAYAAAGADGWPGYARRSIRKATASRRS
jgi:porphobilinogen synthase